MTEIDILKHHHGHDMAELKGKHRNLLVEQLAPLLRDAFDAIEIGAQNIALSRIQRALDAIEASAG